MRLWFARKQLLHILANPRPYLDQLPPHFWKYLAQSFLEFKYGAPAPSIWLCRAWTT